MQCINILSNHCSIDMEEKETTNLTSPILFLGVKELPPQGCEPGSLGAVNSCPTRYAMTPHINGSCLFSASDSETPSATGWKFGHQHQGRE